jgi:hypothetical protein
MSNEQARWKAAIIAISVIASLFFTTTLALTFFARGYIQGKAQEFVVERSVPIADAAVATAEKALQIPLAQQFLGADALRIARLEIADYRRDRQAYITRLVTGRRPVPVAVPDRMAPVEERLTEWKDAVRRYFDRTIDGLVRDLRIFSGSNLAAAVLAAWFAVRAQGGRLKRLLIISGLLLVSLAYGTLLYIDEFSYFRILFNSYIGWWYPAILAYFYYELYWEHSSRDADPSDTSQQPTPA